LPEVQRVEEAAPLEEVIEGQSVAALSTEVEETAP
jgi:hypothetical protein